MASDGFGNLDLGPEGNGRATNDSMRKDMAVLDGLLSSLRIHTMVEMKFGGQATVREYIKASDIVEEACRDYKPIRSMRNAYCNYALAKILGDGALIDAAAKALKTGLGMKDFIAEGRSLGPAEARAEVDKFNRMIDAKLGMTR